MTASADPAVVADGTARARRRPPPQVDRVSVRALCTLLVVVVAGQRLAVPAGALVVPLSLVCAYGVALLLLLRGAVQVDRLRVELFVLASAACAGAGYLTVFQELGAPLSLPSLLLLLVIYALWVLRRAAPLAGAHDAVLSTFLRTMLVLSVVGMLQMAAQYSGAWSYQDYLGQAVPPELLVPGYNTNAPTGYLSPIFRGNAFVFLEPSFLSQFCALALLLALVRRAPAWQLGVLAGGLASAVSGTGFLLLAVGLAVLVVRDRAAIRAGYVGVGVVSAALLLVTPFGLDLVDRVGEFGQSGTSASLRFIQPYTETVRGLDQDLSRYVVGAGPGSSERLLLSNRGGAIGAPVTYTTAPKLVFEYGLVAGGSFMVFLVVAMFRGAALPVLPAALLVMTWVLSGALLQSHTAVLVWLLVVLWASGEPGRVLTGRRRPGGGAGGTAAPAT